MDQATQAIRFADVQLPNGPRLAYAEQGDVEGEVIVFLHGWPDSWFSFCRVLPLLDEHHHVYAIDQRGFGESSKPDDGFVIDDFAGDVLAFLDALGHDRATLVGHSYGSFVARRVAEIAPDRVARLVLIGTAISGVNDVTLELRESLTTLPDPIPEPFAREFQSSTAHVPLPEDFFDRIIQESLKLPARLWPIMIDGLLAFDDGDDLDRITAPTLLIWGEHDALFNRREVDRLRAAMPLAQLTVYADTGHCPNWERPGHVAADIERFLRVT